jgi:hypothetical protein
MLSSDTVLSWQWSKLSLSKHDNSHNKARIGLIFAELRSGRGCTGSAGCLRVWERYGNVEREGLVLYLQKASSEAWRRSKWVRQGFQSVFFAQSIIALASNCVVTDRRRWRCASVYQSHTCDERWSLSVSRSKQSPVVKNSVPFAAKTSVSSVKKLKQVCVVVSEVAGAPGVVPDAGFFARRRKSCK